MEPKSYSRRRACGLVDLTPEPYRYRCVVQP